MIKFLDDINPYVMQRHKDMIKQTYYISAELLVRTIGLHMNRPGFSENDKNLETNGNVIMISGCMDSQTSSDASIGGVSRGAMLWSFLDTINKNSSISYIDLLTTMRETLKRSGFSQIPQLSSAKIMNMSEKIRF